MACGRHGLGMCIQMRRHAIEHVSVMCAEMQLTCVCFARDKCLACVRNTSTKQRTCISRLDTSLCRHKSHKSVTHLSPMFQPCVTHVLGMCQACVTHASPMCCPCVSDLKHVGHVRPALVVGSGNIRVDIAPRVPLQMCQACINHAEDMR